MRLGGRSTMVIELSTIRSNLEQERNKLIKELD